MLDVAQHAVGEDLRGDDGDEAGEGDDQRDEQGVLVADEHQQRDRDDGDKRLAHHDRHRQPELPAERAESPPVRGGKPRRAERADGHGRQDERRHERRVPADDEADRERHDSQARGDDQRGPLHELNR